VDSTGPRLPRIEEIEFASALQIDLAQMTRINGGIYVQDVVLGAGAVVGLDSRVVADFELFLTDGRLIESVEDLFFNNGCRQVLPGFETGVWGMRSGGQRTLIVPPDLGYASNPPRLSLVPPGAVLVYRVTVKATWISRDCLDRSQREPVS